jgi:hypothetical protein
MDLENEDVLLGMTIAAIILGIGLSLFFIYPYTGYGAVVIAIGMLTLALMITARPRVTQQVKREVVLQPARQVEPTPITPPTFILPTQEPSSRVSTESKSEEVPTGAEPKSVQTEEAAPPQEAKSEETKTSESTQPQPEEKAPEKQQEEELTTTTPTPS